MKRYVLLLGLLCSVLTGCSDNDEPTAASADELVPIALTGNVVSAEDDAPLSRTPITAGTVKCIFAGLEAASVDEAGRLEEVTWISSGDVEVGVRNYIDLDPLRYYNIDNNVNTYICGWCPAECVLNGMFVNLYPEGATCDASVDICSTGLIDQGSKYMPRRTHMIFKHLTSQLNFKLIAGEEGTALPAVTRILLNGANVPILFCLSGANPLFSTSQDLAVLESDEGMAVPADLTAVGSPLMIDPASTDLTLQVTFAGGTTLSAPIVLNGGNGLEAGKAYDITVTLRHKAVDLQATITADWIPVNQTVEVS